MANLLLGGNETRLDTLTVEEQELDGSLNNCTSPLALYFGPLPSSSEISIHTLHKQGESEASPLPMFVEHCFKIGRFICSTFCVLTSRKSSRLKACTQASLRVCADHKRPGVREDPLLSAVLSARRIWERSGPIRGRKESQIKIELRNFHMWDLT